MDIGELLRHARRHARISQRELAGRTHIPRTTIGRIETGQLDPPLRMLGQLLAASGLRLRFGLEQLASGEPEQPDAELVNYLRRPLADRLEASLRSRGDAALAAGLADVGGDLLWQLVRTLGESPIPGYRVLIIGSAAEGCWHPGVATVIDPAQPVLALCPDQPRGLEMTAVLLEHLALEPPVGGVDGMCGQAAADLELQLATRLGLVRIDLRPASTTGYPDLVEAAVPVAVAGGWLPNCRQVLVATPPQVIRMHGPTAPMEAAMAAAASAANRDSAGRRHPPHRDIDEYQRFLDSITPAALERAFYDRAADPTGTTRGAFSRNGR
jgi:transcriptional regulator with XRE-family HTH domain